MKENFFVLYILILIIFSMKIIIYPLPVYSQDVNYSDIKLNEIMPNPVGNDNDYEWIELYNNSNEDLSLDNCLIDNIGFPLDSKINKSSYLVIAKDVSDIDQNGKSFEEVWGNKSGIWGDDEKETYEVIELNISLKNTNDIITFLCGDYEDSYGWEVSKEGQSYSITFDGDWTDAYNVTPGSINTPKEEIEYYKDIIITEIYPSPKSQSEDNEWIEIYNFGSEDVNLTDWGIRDNTSNYKIRENLTLKSKNYIVIDFINTSISLNNSGEMIYILNPGGEEMDIFNYENTSKGISNIRLLNNGVYSEEIYQTQEPTKGLDNIYIDLDDVFYKYEILDIIKAKEKSLSEIICLEGVVTSEYGLLGKSTFYIQDGTAGIQVYYNNENLAENITLGENIKVLGELKEINSEKRIYISDERSLLLLESKKEIKFNVVKISDVTYELVGSLITVYGQILNTSGDTFYISDGARELKVLVKTSTNIEIPDKKKGQYTKITGILSQYGNEEDSLRLLPRYDEDILISDNPIDSNDYLVNTGQNLKIYTVFGSFLLSVFIIRWLTLYFNSLKISKLCNLSKKYFLF